MEDKQLPTRTFKTPDQVAAEQALETTPIEDAPMPKSSSSNWRNKLHLSWPPGKKEWIVLVVGVLLLTGVGGLALSQPTKTATVTKVAVKKVPPKPTFAASNLSGLPVDPATNLKPVTGIMVENSLDARPQSGLSQARVVFEAIAEGGITRFLALFQDTSPDNVGPIRSARPYYVQWAMGFDAGYAHVGGSPEALASIKSWGARDLDQFANGGSYHRISSRVAPHNVYTGISTLNALETSKGYTSSNFTAIARKKSAPAKVPTAKTIDLTISGPQFNVHYDYNAATNSYNRSEAGAPHLDADTNKQLSPDVVVALVIPYSIMSDGYHSQYQTIGTGQAYVFQDGNVTVGTWTKTDNKTQFVFKDAAGNPLGLNPGQTWITAIANSGAATYAP